MQKQRNIKNSKNSSYQPETVSNGILTKLSWYRYEIAQFVITCGIIFSVCIQNIQNLSLINHQEQASSITIHQQIQSLPPSILAPVIPATPLQHIIAKPAAVSPLETLTVRPKDNWVKLFKRAHLDAPSIKMAHLLPKSVAFDLRINKPISFSISQQHHIQSISYERNITQKIEITFNRALPIVKITDIPLDTHIARAGGTIHSYLQKDALHAGLPASLIQKLNNVFALGITPSKRLGIGDRFDVVFEKLYANNHLVKTGELLAVRIISHKKTYYAIRYKNGNSSIQYYTEKGQSMQTAFVRSPVHYTRIGSRFNERRMHPILHVIRPHEGVDLCAPEGTPIHAVSDGRISFKGRHGGYGEVVVINHGSRYSTLYAHMSRFASGFHVNSPVKMGEIIGYVGHTGMATGPHIHYEFRINGVHYDPMKVALPKGPGISFFAKRKFNAYTSQLIAQLNNTSKIA
jgi:murein DD-endopeptidase MepM/ murein hydrolase activator NlpD